MYGSILAQRTLQVEREGGRVDGGSSRRCDEKNGEKITRTTNRTMVQYERNLYRHRLQQPVIGRVSLPRGHFYESRRGPLPFASVPIVAGTPVYLASVIGRTLAFPTTGTDKLNFGHLATRVTNHCFFLPSSPRHIPISGGFPRSVPIRHCRRRTVWTRGPERDAER